MVKAEIWRFYPVDDISGACSPLSSFSRRVRVRSYNCRSQMHGERPWDRTRGGCLIQNGKEDAIAFVLLSVLS